MFLPKFFIFFAIGIASRDIYYKAISNLIFESLFPIKLKKICFRKERSLELEI